MGPVLAMMVVVALLTACSSDEEGVRSGDADVTDTTAGSEPARRYRATGMVLESGSGGPDLCSSSLDSYPPQCGSGIPLEGWDWSQVSGFEEANGTRWGDFEVVGTWDGETLAVVSAGPPGDRTGMAGGDPTDRFTTPCPEPEGGWAVPADTPKMTPEDESAAHDYARAQPEYSASWVDNSTQADFDPDRLQEFRADPAQIVTVFRFSADAEQHEAAIRDRWGGPICVVEGGRALRELEAVRSEVEDEMPFASSYIDEIAGTLVLGVTVVDPAVQADLDRRFGEETVELQGFLQPVD